VTCPATDQDDDPLSGARTLANYPMPRSVAALPRDRHGYPIPWFVAELDDGTRDFRIADADKNRDAKRLRLCWICGQHLGGYLAFAVGPMCTVNRVSAEPPAHRDCAIFAARCCPFLAVPAMRRRTANTPDGVVEPPGFSIKRNPGAVAVWITRKYTVDRSGLCFMGDPTEVLWYHQGRPATADEVRAAFATGLPLLEATCAEDRDPAASRRALARDYYQALQWVPA
jgi:hypothetical protein